MALCPFLITKLKPSELTPTDINHEKIHFRQQLELLLIGFYVWYLVEFLIKLAQKQNSHKAYKAISFEKEAYKNEGDTDYLRHRKRYAWFKFYFNVNKKV